MRKDDRLLRVAVQLHRRLHQVASERDDPFTSRVNELLAQQFTVTALLRRIVRAQKRGWHLTANRLRADLPYTTRSVTTSCYELEQTCSPRDAPIIPLKLIVEELRQLHSEFEHVDLSQRGMIVAHSEPIELEGVHLGRFAIELHLERLKNRQGSSCFNCVALDPNAASRSEETTHPHVQGNSLCAGDASTPIAHALRQGRICDAFVLIHSVLQTYNPSSPFISLDGWHGVACEDCGHSTDRDGLYRCEGCENDYCDACISCCDLCGASRCRNCLDRDIVSDLRLCPACQGRCASCRRIVDKDSFDTGSSLCPACLEAQQEAEQLEDVKRDTEPNTPTTPNQEPNHEPIPTPVTATAVQTISPAEQITSAA